MDHRKEIRNAIVLGIDVESDDPNMHHIVSKFTEEQVDWLASWLASEGIGRIK